MGVKIKLDEDLADRVGEPLRGAGHPVASTVGQGWGGLKDFELWPKVQAAGEYFVTADKGFGDIRAYPPGTHGGILLLRPDHESIADYQALVAKVVREHDIEALRGAITVATPRGIRVRRRLRK